MRLLAVDDSAIVRDLLPRLFRDTGYPPLRLAEDGASALAILDEPGMRFDCLLLDIEMPGMSGIELCSRIRARPEHRETPIIMLTALSDADTIENAFAAGANDYIVKRFDVKEFTGRVKVAERLLLRRGPFRLTPAFSPAARGRAGRDVGRHGFTPEDELVIAGVKRLIAPFSLGNYLTQLPRKALDDCAMVAVRIERVELIHGSTSTSDFATMIGAVALAIQETLDCPRLLMAYTGRGEFVCILRGGEIPAPAAFEAELSHHLDRLADTTGMAWLNRVELTAGSAVPPCANRTQRVRKSFQRVRERARARHLSRLAAEQGDPMRPHAL